MFNYEKFENDIVQSMQIILERWIKENNDLYIFSLDCVGQMDSIGAIANTFHYLKEQTEQDSEDYLYYKYCEEEWDLFHTFEDISVDMCKELEDNSDIFINSETHKYSDVFEEHRCKIIECCGNALIRFRKILNLNHPHILLTLNIREYLDGEDRMEIFDKINNQNMVKEYFEYMTEFV